MADEEIRRLQRLVKMGDELAALRLGTFLLRNGEIQIPTTMEEVDHLYHRWGKIAIPALEFAAKSQDFWVRSRAEIALKKLDPPEKNYCPRCGGGVWKGAKDLGFCDLCQRQHSTKCLVECGCGQTLCEPCFENHYSEENGMEFHQRGPKRRNPRPIGLFAVSQNDENLRQLLRNVREDPLDEAAWLALTMAARRAEGKIVLRAGGGGGLTGRIFTQINFEPKSRILSLQTPIGNYTTYPLKLFKELYLSKHRDIIDLDFSGRRRNPRPDKVIKYGLDQLIRNFYNRGLSDQQIHKNVNKEIEVKIGLGELPEDARLSFSTIQRWRTRQDLTSQHKSVMEILAPAVLVKYKEGLRDSELSDFFGVDRATIELWREKNNLPANRGKLGNQFMPIEEVKMKIVKELLEGKNQLQISKELGVNRGLVISVSKDMDKWAEAEFEKYWDALMQTMPTQVKSKWERASEKARLIGKREVLPRKEVVQLKKTPKIRRYHGKASYPRQMRYCAPCAKAGRKSIHRRGPPNSPYMYCKGSRSQRNPDEDLRALERELSLDPENEELAFRYRHLQFRSGAIKGISCLWCEGKGHFSTESLPDYHIKCFHCSGHGFRTREQNLEDMKRNQQTIQQIEDFFGPNGQHYNDYRLTMQGLNFTEGRLKEESHLMDLEENI